MKRQATRIPRPKSAELLGYEQACELMQIAKNHPRMPAMVIDDGCHERAEIVVKLGISSGINKELLRRAFLFNSTSGEYLKLEKPLARNQALKDWFSTQRVQGRLQHGAIFESGNTRFKVDSFGALRAENWDTIYLDDNPIATWGVGHVAAMVGDFVVDTAFSKPLVFTAWRDAMQLNALVPLIGKLREIPELYIDALDAEGISKVTFALKKNIPVKFSAKPLRETLKSLYGGLDEQDKQRFFNDLFAEQIKSGALYDREHWTEVYPGPLTSRGESLDTFCPAMRGAITRNLADSNDQERLDAALNILRPFKDYENMILGAKFNWYPPS